MESTAYGGKIIFSKKRALLLYLRNPTESFTFVFVRILQRHRKHMPYIEVFSRENLQRKFKEAENTNQTRKSQSTTKS